MYRHHRETMAKVASIQELLSKIDAIEEWKLHQIVRGSQGLKSNPNAFLYREAHEYAESFTSGTLSDVL